MTKGIWIMFVLSIMSKCVVSDLKGANVCQEEQRYKVNVTKYVLRNVTVRSYQWCLQVPPRCSTYAVQQINDTKIEEEMKTRSVSKCCDGFYETIEETCLPDSCRFCQHGQCAEDGVCTCELGYWGSKCDQECTPDEWKDNCRQDCTNCAEGHCNVSWSNCTVCPPKFIRCDLICSEGQKYNKECLKDCGCHNIIACDPLRNECRTVENDYDTIATENDEYLNTISVRDDLSGDEKHRKVINLPDMSTESLGTVQNINLNYLTTEPHGNEDKRTTFTNIATEKVEREPIHETKFDLRTITISENNIDLTEATFTEKSTNLILKSSEKHEDNDYIVDSIKYLGGNSTPFDNKTKEKHALHSTNYTSHNLVVHDHMFAAIISAGLFSALIIISAAVFCVLHKLEAKKKKYIEAARNSIDNGKEDVKLKEIGQSLSVTTRSIFHTPLPEPPTFENPAFLTPVEGIQTKQPGILETHIICNLNIPKVTSHDQPRQEFFYDHPPTSTGKFRLVSLPDAPNSNSGKINFDPIYDEIPCHQRIVPVQEQSILYMNT